jgi:hypothetical protein
MWRIYYCTKICTGLESATRIAEDWVIAWVLNGIVELKQEPYAENDRQVENLSDELFEQIIARVEAIKNDQVRATARENAAWLEQYIVIENRRYPSTN